MATQTEKPPATSAAPTRTELPRTLGLLSAVAILIGSTIGSGIFRTPAGIATRIPNEGLYLLLWILGGFFSLCGALTLSELAGALPHTGGVFVYLREGFGKLPAFLFGWAELTIIRASALGGIAMVFGEYLVRLMGPSRADSLSEMIHSVLRVPHPEPARYLAAAAIVLVAIFNIVGVRLGALVQNLTTAAKYAALLLLVVAAFLVGASHPAPVNAPAATPESPLVVRFGLAFISLLWVYDGWADVTFLSGEVKDPARNLPRAIISGTLAVIAIYLLANFAYLHLLDITQIASSKLVAADTAFRIIGDAGVNFVSIAVMISAFGTLNGSMMTGPRIFFSMADEGLFIRKIAAVHPRFRTPYVAIGLAACLAVVFVMVRSFEQLTDTFVLGIWPFYAAGAAAVYVLRRKRPDLPRQYRTLGYPVTPALFIIAVALLVGNALFDDINHPGYYRALFSGAPASGGSGALMVATIVLLGVPAYYVWQAVNSRRKDRGSRIED
jgi:basic amino acid/polyamine antiporter, APA family